MTPPAHAPAHEPPPVLVGVDTEDGYEALRAAAALASACGAQLHAATAVEPTTWTATGFVKPVNVDAHAAVESGRV